MGKRIRFPRPGRARLAVFGRVGRCWPVATGHRKLVAQGNGKGTAIPNTRIACPILIHPLKRFVSRWSVRLVANTPGNLLLRDGNLSSDNLPGCFLDYVGARRLALSPASAEAVLDYR